jgi:hypothetical protein
MGIRLLPGYWTLAPGEEITITYWWEDADLGLRMAVPYPYFSAGIWATTTQGVNFEGAPFWKYFVTVQNWTNRTASFRLRSGELT